MEKKLNPDQYADLQKVLGRLTPYFFTASIQYPLREAARKAAISLQATHDGFNLEQYRDLVRYLLSPYHENDVAQTKEWSEALSSAASYLSEEGFNPNGLDIFKDAWQFTEKDGVFYVLLGQDIIADSPHPEIANLIALIPDTIRVAFALKSALGTEITEEERAGLIQETEEFFSEALHITTTPVN